jgi:hypothetical protein
VGLLHNSEFRKQLAEQRIASRSQRNLAGMKGAASRPGSSNRGRSEAWSTMSPACSARMARPLLTSSVGPRDAMGWAARNGNFVAAS